MTYPSSTPEDVLERYESHPDVDSKHLETAKQFCLRRIQENIEPFADHFPSASSENLYYEASDLEGWTPSFWSGMLWLAYETTDKDAYRSVAESQLPRFADRLETEDVIGHDIGFLYTLSAIASSMLTDNPASEQMALDAADRLTERYWPDPGIIQAWGDPAEPEATDWGQWAHGRIIADTMMNLPLLFMASIATEDDQYHEIATNHAENTARYLVRDDGSTFHTYKFDVTTGAPIGGETFQGFADNSCWSRGQAWIIYGLALAARYTDEEAFLQTAVDVADFYLKHLPEDHVPRWDFRAPEADDVRDSSAAAIAACGLFELSSHFDVGTTQRSVYENAAVTTLGSLTESYTTESSDSNGILKEGTYNKPNGDYGECCIWGDYFYFEGLVRATSDWESYW
ncbi:glycosyl hydrolase family 88 [Haloferax sp. Atlit-4N]|nr:glycosyl hydrolase family 88 [Haloferax sp. Atlit-4N]